MNRSRVTGDLASHGNIFVDIANDRVGIGSTIPTQKLDVTGNFAVSGQTNLTGDLTLTSTDAGAAAAPTLPVRPAGTYPL